jgi:hypothetical protein
MLENQGGIMRSPRQTIYQQARMALQDGQDCIALDGLTMAAEMGHPVAVRLFKSLAKKPRTLFIKGMVINGVSVGAATVTLRTNPKKAAALPRPALTSYPPLPTV